MRVNKVIQKCVSFVGIMALLLTSAPVYAGEMEESTAYEAEVVTGDTTETVKPEEEVIEEFVGEPETEEGTEEITAEEETEAAVVDEEAEATEEAPVEPLDEVEETGLKEEIKALNNLGESNTIPIPSQPVFSQVKCSSYNSIYLRWNMVDSSSYPANGYKIYRSTDQKNYKLIADIDEIGDYLYGTSNYVYTNAQSDDNGASYYYTYTDKSLSTGKTYYYKLVAYNYDVDETETKLIKKDSKYSSVKSAKPVMKTPTLKVTNVNESKLKLTWSKVSGANGYVVQRSTKKDSGYKTIKTITKGSTVTYTNSNLTLGKTYYYRVRAYRTVSGQKVYSNYSGKKGLQVKLKKPVIKKLEAAKTSRAIVITWGKINKAQGYVIYRATSYNGTYTKYKTVKGGTKISTTANQELYKNYYYKIRAYRKVNGKNVYSPYSAIDGCYLYIK